MPSNNSNPTRTGFEPTTCCDTTVSRSIHRKSNWNVSWGLELRCGFLLSEVVWQPRTVFGAFFWARERRSFVRRPHRRRHRHSLSRFSHWSPLHPCRSRGRLRSNRSSSKLKSTSGFIQEPRTWTKWWVLKPSLFKLNRKYCFTVRCDHFDTP